MKRLVLLSSMLVAVTACGARSPLEPCAQGSEGCACLAGACNPGLACVAEMCVSLAAPPAGSGGAVGTGGSGGGGGQVNAGGNVGSGGWLGDGGRVGMGGAIGTGGVPWISSGGRMGAGGSTAIVTFMGGRADGLMDGWGWVALGAKDSLSSPTCGGKPITATSPCTATTTWSSNIGLCIAGAIPALPAMPTDSDYNDNWGIMVATECRDPPAPLGGAFRSINIQLDGAPTSGLRAVVHRTGDADATNYCTPMTSNTPIAFTAFNTKCWDGSGTPLTLGDVPNLDWIGVQIPSTSSAIRINLCLGAIFLIP